MARRNITEIVKVSLHGVDDDIATWRGSRLRGVALMGVTWIGVARRGVVWDRAVRRGG